MKNQIIIGLSKSKELAKTVSKKSGITFIESQTNQFADREIIVSFDETVRNKEVFLFQSTSFPVNDSLMELLIALDALKRASAKEVTVVMPYYGYSRQDRKSSKREPITAKLVADLLEKAGANRIIVLDLHSNQIQGFFNIPVDNVSGTEFLANKIKKEKSDKLTIVSPDHGGTVRARSVANILSSPLAVIDKRRTQPNKAEATFILGNVSGRNILLVDDIIDTGGTIISAVKLLKKEGAEKISILVTHSVFSTNTNNKKEVFEKLMDAGIDFIYTTSSIEKEYEDKHLIVHDLGKLFAKILISNSKNESMSEFFKKE